MQEAASSEKDLATRELAIRELAIRRRRTEAQVQPNLFSLSLGATRIGLG